MPRRLASVKSGAVSFEGISCSKKESTSAWSGMNQRGKNVVSVSSGNTTRSQPMRLASRSSAIMRSTTSRRVWLRWMGPIWAAPTVKIRVILDPPPTIIAAGAALFQPVGSADVGVDLALELRDRLVRCPLEFNFHRGVRDFVFGMPIQLRHRIHRRVEEIGIDIDLVGTVAIGLH